MSSRNVSSKWQCTRCNKNYQYKGGLTAHIKRKHPVTAEPINPKKRSRPVAPPSSSARSAQVPSNPVQCSETIDMEELIEDEQEWFEAVEELEHNVGVNASMVDWYNVNFNSSFSNTGEFSNRTAVVPQHVSCDDCKVNSTSFEKQRDLLLKQDKQIQDYHRSQKENINEIKSLKNVSKGLESRLQETTSMLETVLEESTAEITKLKADLKTKEDLLKVTQTKVAPKAPKEKSLHDNEVKIDLEKCKICGFSSESKIIITQHMQIRHKGVKVYKCLMCSVISKSKESYREHKKMHQQELDVITFKHVCRECNLSFGSREQELEHMLEKHRPRQDNKKKSGPLYAQELEDCKNGPSCTWLKNKRCKFEHSEQPWKTVQHRRQKQLSRKESEQRQQPRQQQQARAGERKGKKETENCLNGPSCKFLKHGKCKFSHEQNRQGGRHSRPSEHNVNVSSIQLRPCKFGNRCDKGMSCTYLHLPKDFLSSKGGRRQ